MSENLTVGRIVHYTTRKEDGLQIIELLPSVVLRTEGGLVLRVLVPQILGKDFDKIDPPHSEAPTPGCWSWPARTR